MVSDHPSPVAESFPDQSFSRLRIHTTLSGGSLQSMGGMDIADVKLHRLMPVATVKEMPSSPASVSSAESFSSISSRTSNYRAIYPPGVPDVEESMDLLVLGNSPRDRRVGSIDQLIEWTRNVNNSTIRDIPISAQRIPPSGSECPLLTDMPPKVMDLCGSAWARVQQRMRVQLLCRGVQDCSQLGLYEIASGIAQGAYVAAITIFPRSISKAGILEQRLREIADQEWKDIPPIRVWWVDEKPGSPLSAPMVSKESMAWSPMAFTSMSARSASGSSIRPRMSRREDQGEDDQVHQSSPVLRPHFPRRRSSAIVQTPEELSPTSNKHGDLLTDELDAKLRKLIMSA